MSDQKEIENDDELPEENRENERPEKQKNTFAILKHIKVKKNGSIHNKALKVDTFTLEGKPSSQGRRLDSLEAVVKSVQRQHHIKLNYAEMTIPDQLPPTLQSELTKRKHKLCKKYHITPSKRDFLDILRAHGDNWNVFTSYKMIKHPNMQLFMDTKPVSLSGQVHVGAHQQTEQQKEHIYHINILTRMPHIRCCIIEYRGAYESESFVLESSDVLVYIMSGQITFELMQHEIECPVESQIMVRAGMSWRYEFGDQGGKIKLDVINVNQAHLGDVLDEIKDKYVYIPRQNNNNNNDNDNNNN